MRTIQSGSKTECGHFQVTSEVISLNAQDLKVGETQTSALQTPTETSLDMFKLLLLQHPFHCTPPSP